MAGYEELVELLPESWADPTSVKFTVVKIVEFVRIHRGMVSEYMHIIKEAKECLTYTLWA